MRYNVRCQFCGRELMDDSPLADDMLQCMACGLESLVEEAKFEYAKAHWKHDSPAKSLDPLSPENLEAWRLKR